MEVEGRYSDKLTNQPRVIFQDFLLSPSLQQQFVSALEDFAAQLGDHQFLFLLSCCLGSRHGGRQRAILDVEKVVGLTDFVIIHVFIAAFSPAQGEHNQIVNAKFTRPVNAMPMSSSNSQWNASESHEF